MAKALPVEVKIMRAKIAAADTSSLCAIAGLNLEGFWDDQLAATLAHLSAHTSAPVVKTFEKRMVKDKANLEKLMTKLVSACKESERKGVSAAKNPAVTRAKTAVLDSFERSMVDMISMQRR